MGCETKEDIKELKRLKKELAKDPNRVDLLFKAGMLLFDPFMKVDEGLPYLEKAMTLEPQNPDLPFWTGYALYHGKCFYKEAQMLFERALSLDSDRPEFNYMMFNVLWQAADTEDISLKYLLKAVELQPGWLEPREQYIMCLINKNELDKAEKELKEAYEILNKLYKNKNKKTIITNSLQRYNREPLEVVDYEFEKDGLDSTKRDLQKEKKLWRLKSELAKDQNNVDLLINVGILLLGRFAGKSCAIPYFEKAVKLNPNNPDSLFWLGYAFYKDMLDYEEAKESFEMALSLSPDRPEFNYMMFKALCKINDSQDAGLKYLLKAIKLQPDWIDPRRWYVIYLMNKNEFSKAEKELAKVYEILDELHKNKKTIATNILELHNLESSFGYRFEKSDLDMIKRNLKEKKEQNNGSKDSIWHRPKKTSN